MYSLHCPGDGSRPSEARLSLIGNSCQQLLDLSNSSAWVEALGTGLGAVHDCVAPVHTEGVPELVQPLSLVTIPAVYDPPVGLHQHSRPKVPDIHGLNNFLVMFDFPHLSPFHQ